MKLLNPFFVNFFIIVFINVFIISFFVYIKCLKIYEQNIIKKIKKDYRKSLRKISNEEKEKKRQYGCERYKNLSENKKENFVEYREQYHRVRKNAIL